MKTVRAARSLNALPVGTRIEYLGRRATFGYTKQADGSWVEAAPYWSNAALNTTSGPAVRSTETLAAAIQRVCGGRGARVLPAGSR